MYSEFLRIQHSIDAIDNFKQVAPTFKWVKIFEQRFRDVAEVQEKTQILLNQLADVQI